MRKPIKKKNRWNPIEGATLEYRRDGYRLVFTRESGNGSRWDLRDFNGVLICDYVTINGVNSKPPFLWADKVLELYKKRNTIKGEPVNA